MEFSDEDIASLAGRLIGVLGPWECSPDGTVGTRKGVFTGKTEATLHRTTEAGLSHWSLKIGTWVTTTKDKSEMVLIMGWADGILRQDGWVFQ